MENYKRAVELLQNVLLESSMENEFDKDIYEFLKEENQLPDGYSPYWVMDEFEDDDNDLVTLERGSIWTEVRNDFVDDEAGKVHIDGWLTEDGDEDGKVIAKIDIQNGDVEYLDERAKTDKVAQDAITEAMLRLTFKNKGL